MGKAAASSSNHESLSNLLSSEEDVISLFGTCHPCYYVRPYNCDWGPKHQPLPPPGRLMLSWSKMLYENLGAWCLCVQCRVEIKLLKGKKNAIWCFACHLMTWQDDSLMSIELSEVWHWTMPIFLVVCGRLGYHWWLKEPADWIWITVEYLADRGFLVPVFCVEQLAIVDIWEWPICKLTR